jgi:hypothetical protein
LPVPARSGKPIELGREVFHMAKYRSAKTGKYVKPSYAKSHPATTVKETDKKK